MRARFTASFLTGTHPRADTVYGSRSRRTTSITLFLRGTQRWTAEKINNCQMGFQFTKIVNRSCAGTDLKRRPQLLKCLAGPGIKYAVYKPRFLTARLAARTPVWFACPWDEVAQRLARQITDVNQTSAMAKVQGL